MNADSVRITQCVGNLLRNALKYTQEAGEAWFSLETEKGEAIILVRDNGMGIGSDLLQHIFEPFTQANTSLDRGRGGSLGLGLSIVDGIVRLHGGRVTAFSEGIGQGSVFTIRLPLSVPVRETQKSEVSKKAIKSYKIMLIEDNKSLADILLSIFNLMGHEAHTVHTGPEGIAEAKKIIQMSSSAISACLG